MSQTFDEKYNQVVQKMIKHLQKDGLTMINWIDTNYWEFKLSKISKSRIAKMKREEKKYKTQQSSTSVSKTEKV